MKKRRERWHPSPEIREDAQTLAAMHDAVIECLVNARGGSREEQEAYLREVLARVGVEGVPRWSDLYRCIALLRQDALDEGQDLAVVQQNAAKLQRILERVED